MHNFTLIDWKKKDTFSYLKNGAQECIIEWGIQD